MKLKVLFLSFFCFFQVQKIYSDDTVDDNKYKSSYSIQALSTSSKERALKFANSIEGYDIYIHKARHVDDGSNDRKILHQVRIGLFESRSIATKAQENIRKLFPNNFSIQNSLVVSFTEKLEKLKIVKKSTETISAIETIVDKSNIKEKRKEKTQERGHSSDYKKGKLLLEKSKKACSVCHEYEIFKNTETKFKNRYALHSHIDNYGPYWFGDEVDMVVNYLDKDFYHFEGDKAKFKKYKGSN